MYLTVTVPPPAIPDVSQLKRKHEANLSQGIELAMAMGIKKHPSKQNLCARYGTVFPPGVEAFTVVGWNFNCWTLFPKIEIIRPGFQRWRRHWCWRYWWCCWSQSGRPPPSTRWRTTSPLGVRVGRLPATISPSSKTTVWLESYKNSDLHDHFEEVSPSRAVTALKLNNCLIVKEEVWWAFWAVSRLSPMKQARKAMLNLK